MVGYQLGLVEPAEALEVLAVQECPCNRELVLNLGVGYPPLTYANQSLNSSFVLLTTYCRFFYYTFMSG